MSILALALLTLPRNIAIINISYDRSKFISTIKGGLRLVEILLYKYKKILKTMQKNSFEIRSQEILKKRKMSLRSDVNDHVNSNPKSV